MRGNEITKSAEPEMHRVHDDDIPTNSNLAGPMTRRRFKLEREREGPEEEVISAKGNESNNNNYRERIDITPLGAFAIASSMLNCSYGDAETQLSESEEEEDHSLQKLAEPMDPPMTDAEDNNNTMNTNEGDMEGSAWTNRHFC